MKLSLNIDLTAAKEAASNAVDMDILERISRLSIIHSKKVEWARSSDDHPALIQEAILRNISVADLKAMILSKSAETDAMLAALEVERQARKKHIREATSEQELR